MILVWLLVSFLTVYAEKGKWNVQPMTAPKLVKVITYFYLCFILFKTSFRNLYFFQRTYTFVWMSKSDLNCILVLHKEYLFGISDLILCVNCSSDIFLSFIILSGGLTICLLTTFIVLFYFIQIIINILFTFIP